jgi:hypothetical protein
MMTAKPNDIDPQAWLADVFARIAETPQRRPAELLPWSGSANLRATSPLRQRDNDAVQPKVSSPRPRPDAYSLNLGPEN